MDVFNVLNEVFNSLIKIFFIPQKRIVAILVFPALALPDDHPLTPHATMIHQRFR